MKNVTFHRAPASRRLYAFTALLVIICNAGTPVGQERGRATVDDRYKWNIAEIYTNLDAWRAHKARVAADVPIIRTFERKLGTSPQVLAAALELRSQLDRDLSRLRVYADMLADEDTRISEPRGMLQEMQQLSAEFSAQSSFMEPEVLQLGDSVVEEFLRAEPRLKNYAFYLRDTARRSNHTLTDSEERLLASTQPMAVTASNIYGILTNADFQYPQIALSDGRTVKIDQAGYAELRTLPRREDRQKVMAAFFGGLGSFSRTFGTMMNANLQRAFFYARTRKYGSPLEATLDGPNIPTAVYSRLVEGVNKNLPTFHRYLRLRKRMLGLAEPLHYYDLYAPLVASVNLKYTPEEAQQHVLAAMAPLGADYVSVMHRAFSERWIDWFPTDGKRSGAYSNGGAYEVHPYVLLNYQGQYNDVSTLAHELGHAMHNYHSNAAQPYVLADYPVFLAEVASTFNEALLIEYFLKQIKDADTRLALLGNYLEGIKSTVFRQTQFAEFELAMHDRTLKGEPITGATLAALYLEITRKYYGHDQNVVVVDDYVAHEWSYVPHFYRDFYVFQYATSFTAAEALAAKVLGGDTEAKKRYLAFIASGGSNYPVALLRDAGVDMASDEPLNLTLRRMNRVIDEIEALLAARERH